MVGGGFRKEVDVQNRDSGVMGHGERTEVMLTITISGPLVLCQMQPPMAGKLPTHAVGRCRGQGELVCGEGSRSGV